MKIKVKRFAKLAEKIMPCDGTTISIGNTINFLIMSTTKAALGNILRSHQA
jgi:hypothetical protein